MRASYRRRLGAGIAGAGLLVVAGCGGSSSSNQSKLSDMSPKQELTQSIENLGDSDVLTMRLKLDATKEELTAIAKSSSDQFTASDQKVIDILAGADVEVTTQAPQGKKLKDVKPGDPTQAEVSVDAQGSKIVEFRVVDKVLYLRADVKKIMELADQPPQTLAQLQARIPASLGFAQAALQGKWVSISEEQIKSLGQQLGASTPPSANTQQQQQLIDQLKGIIDKDVSVTRTSAGGGDVLTMTASSTALVSDLVKAITPLVGGSNPALSQLDPTKVPEKTVTVTASVQDGKLQSMSMDLTQFASAADKKKMGGKALPLKVEFEQQGADISKPSDVTPVDLTQLFTVLGALGSSTSG